MVDGSTVHLKTHKENLTHDAALRRENRCDAVGQLLGQSGHLLTHNLTGAEDIHTPVELYKNKAAPLHGSGAYTAHIGGSVDGGLDGEGNQAFHLLGGHAVSIGHDHHLRSGEVGKDIDVSAVGRP